MGAGPTALGHVDGSFGRKTYESPSVGSFSCTHSSLLTRLSAALVGQQWAEANAGASKDERVP